MNRPIALRDRSSSLDRLNERLRPEGFGQVGDASRFDRGGAASLAVVAGNIYHRRRDAAVLKQSAQFDPRFAVQIDIDNHADRL